jgi:PKD repeat protein
MVRYMRARTGMRFFAIVFCILCLALATGAYAGCGVDTNPYDNDPGPLPNGYYPPSADFSGDPVQGYAPLTVTFSDKSTNVPLYWSWNFGDGQSSNEKNPVHTYQSPGMYTVLLTAENRYGGNSITKSNYVTVNPASSIPVVDFTAAITTGYAPLQVEFSDLSTGGIIISRGWTFDRNGIPVSETTPGQKIVHTFTEAGQYNVTLTVTAENNESASLQKSYYISVRQPAPEYGTIILHPGWNLVSTPVPLKEQYHTAGQVFAGIDTDSRSIFSYDAGSKQFIPLNPNSEIFPLEGIWVYSKNETPLTFSYQVTQPVTISMHMPSGWNLIGYPSTEPGNAREGFITIGNIWSTILCFDPVTQQYSSTIFNEGAGGQSDQQIMYPTNGYWIFMPNEGDLITTLN